MLQKIKLGVIATLACLLTAEDARSQFIYRFGTPQPPWSIISQNQPLGSYYGSTYGGYPGFSYYYTGQTVLPGFSATGYAPRMRATLEPAVRLEDAAVLQSDVAPAALSQGERDSIRPAANTYGASSDTLVPRAVSAAPAVRHATMYQYYGGQSCWPSSSIPYGY